MTRPVASLPDDLRSQIIGHCLAEFPNEGCGLLAVSGDVVVKVYPTANQDASPTSYTIPPAQHYDALVDAETQGWEIGGVFHSHPRGSATMSATDLERAIEPGWVYVVVGLGTGEPVLTVSSL